MNSFLGSGLAFPLKMTEDGLTFLSVGGEEKIKQSIYIILMTKTGERPLEPEFGSRIHDYVYELPSETIMSLLCNEIIQSIYRWEHRVEDVEAAVDTSLISDGRVIISVTYKVRATNRPDNLVFPYYLEEGQW